MRKSRDSVRGVSESANCTWRENRGEEACAMFALICILLVPWQKEIPSPLLVFSSCIRNSVPINVTQGVSELCEISKI